MKRKAAARASPIGEVVVWRWWRSVGVAKWGGPAGWGRRSCCWGGGAAVAVVETEAMRATARELDRAGGCRRSEMDYGWRSWDGWRERVGVVTGKGFGISGCCCGGGVGNFFLIFFNSFSSFCLLVFFLIFFFFFFFAWFFAEFIFLSWFESEEQIDGRGALGDRGCRADEGKSPLCFFFFLIFFPSNL